jgi:hypothetical protein
MIVMDESRVLSHAGREASKRRRALAGCSARNQRRRAARGLEAEDEKKGENRGRTERDRLQKAYKNLSKGHCGIMGARESQSEITSGVAPMVTSGVHKRSVGC